MPLKSIKYHLNYAILTLREIEGGALNMYKVSESIDNLTRASQALDKGCTAFNKGDVGRASLHFGCPIEQRVRIGRGR